MNNRKHILLACACAAVSLTAMADEAGDTLRERIAEQNSQLAEVRSEVFANPAMQSIRYRGSLTSIAAGYSRHRSTKPVKLEYGDGHDYGFGDISAYLHKGKATIWGNANYYNGKYRNLQYCETSDFEMVAPYVMADTVGGDLRSEHYHFLGGFSYPVGRFNIGAEGEYTAIMEFRTRDPRPRNLTGNLYVKVGASYSLNQGYLLGVAATARKYKQTNEVKMYNEVSVPVTYHSTGMGTDYYRFRGENISTYYKGHTFGGMANITRSDNRGAFASIAYDYTKIEKIISSLNQLPMAELHTYRQNAKVGFNTGNTSSGMAFAITESWSRRNGTENIFGTAMDNMYPQISSAELYSLTRWNFGAEVVWQRSNLRRGFSAGLSATYGNYDEHYREPERRMKVSTVNVNLDLNAHASAGRMLFTGNFAGYCEMATSKSLQVPDGVVNDKLFTPVKHYFDYLSTDHLGITASVEAGYITRKQFMPFVRFAWQNAHYMSGEHSNLIEISVGVKL